MRFYLGTHETVWLERLTVPLFISHRRLMRYKRELPVARAGWALDSGSFTELSKPPHKWVTTVPQYVEAVERYRTEIGHLDWAAPMDWMCEPHIVLATGLSVAEHQERTVANYLEIRDRGPFIPVLQGWSLNDYEHCVELYASAGVDLSEQAIVGVGSVCRRQATEEIGQIMLLLSDLGISTHGFGVKKLGLKRYGSLLTSADSMAWSFRARNSPPMPGHTHGNCANCADFALAWRAETIAQMEVPTQRWIQTTLR